MNSSDKAFASIISSAKYTSMQYAKHMNSCFYSKGTSKTSHYDRIVKPLFISYTHIDTNVKFMSLDKTLQYYINGETF